MLTTLDALARTVVGSERPRAGAVRLVACARERARRAALEAALAGVPWRVADEGTGWPLTLRFVALGVGLTVANDGCPAPPGAATLWHLLTARVRS